MSGFSRDAVKQQAQNDSSGSTGYVKTEYHKIEKGKAPRYFRILPAHPASDEVKNPTALERKKTAFFSVMDTRQGKQVNKAIFNAVVHGGSKKDIVSEYIAFGKAQAEARWGKKTAEYDFAVKMLTQGNNYTDVKVKENSTDVAWAIEVNLLGEAIGVSKLLEIKYTVKEAMLKIAAAHFKGEINDESKAFNAYYLDLDTSYAVGIELTDKNEYSVTTLGRTETFNGKKVPNVAFEVIISDDTFDEWGALRPLATMFRNQYKASDWDYQVEGLQNFENYISQNPQVGAFFQILDTPEFQEIMDETKREVFTAIGEAYDTAPAQKSKPIEDKAPVAPKTKGISVVESNETSSEDGDSNDESDEPIEQTEDEKAAVEAAIARRKARTGK